MWRLRNSMTLGATLSLAATLFSTAGLAQEELPKPESKETTNPRIKLETTLGDIIIELDREKAPISTANFLRYANEKFYDGTIFHRCIENFMIQGGGFDVEMNRKAEGMHPPIKNEWKNGLKNKRGTIAMARTNDPDSATSQFFINVVDNANLDNPISGGAAYAVFGRVVEGMDVVDKIRYAPKIRHPQYPAPGAVTPDPPVIIKSARVLNDEPRKARPGEAERNE